MSLVLETGAGLPSAQSYAGVVAFKAYAKARGASVPAGESACEVLLLKAMDAMQGLDYIGNRATKAQALDWPRVNVTIDGFAYGTAELPIQLVEAQCALAIEAQKVDLLPTQNINAQGAVIEETMGAITTRYADPGRTLSRPIVEKAKAHLRKLLRGGDSFMRVVRA